mgnify:CR=1 FL=1
MECEGVRVGGVCREAGCTMCGYCDAFDAKSCERVFSRRGVKVREYKIRWEAGKVRKVFCCIRHDAECCSSSSKVKLPYRVEYEATT